MSDLTLDEAIFRGSAAACELSAVDFAQLDLRGADITKIRFRECGVGALICDSTTRLPPEFPPPGILFLEEKGKRYQVVDPRAVDGWLRQHSKHTGAVADDVPNEYQALLMKLCRVIIRQSWIRMDDDDRAGRLLDHPAWPKLRAVLDDEGFLVSRALAAQGPRSEFIRVRRARELLDPFPIDPEVRQLLARVAYITEDEWS